MIALDTNVLARFVLQDDPVQSAKANRAIAALTPENPGFVPAVVLCELVWVLQSSYKMPRSDCAETLEHILSVTSLKVEHDNLCWNALRAYRWEKADFCDFFIQELAHASGCDTVLTFDKAALKSPGFTAPK